MSLNLSLDFFHFKVGAVKQGGYEFGNFRIDPETKMLYRGGTEITLPPKVIETLIVLVENQGEIVSKTELMDIVWPDTVVEESNLSQHLYYLRKTLGNAPDGTPIIETLRRRGYRFNAVATRIGSASLSSRPGSSPRPTVQNLSIRRHGNVLTVADWEAEPAPLASPVRPVVDGTVDRRNKRPILAYGVIGALTVGLVAVSLWLLQGRSAVRTETVEDIQTAFLTNGRPVEGVAISPDGNYFAYHELEAPIGRLWVQQTGQSGRVEIVPAAERWMGAKTFSPDGQFIYYVAREASDPLAALYRVPTLGGPHTKVLQNVLMPVTFSPDGK